MLNIRREQLAVFREPALRAFTDRVIIHLNKCFPKECKALGEPEVRDTIRDGIERAAAYGIVAERDVCRYIDLMMAFGRQFDEAPQLPWAQAVLRNEALRDPSMKVKRLFDEAKKHREGARHAGS